MKSSGRFSVVTVSLLVQVGRIEAHAELAKDLLFAHNLAKASRRQYEIAAHLKALSRVKT